uniref:Golgin subfamily A member 2-like n=1 Tax=Sinocyclocheilus grahami TaxID=75366 RepID=A0A672P4C4_SINGR
VLDQRRRGRLKQLKEFQLKTTPSTASAGPKKKRKVKAGDQLDAAADRNSPDNVSQVRVSQELEETSAEPVSYPASAINSDNAVHNCNQIVCFDRLTSRVCVCRPLSSTESLRQISQQLNGLLSESTTYINGDSGPPTVNEKELETRNQELAAALDSSALTNAQLTSKLETLTKQSQELSDQLQKERKEFEQKFTKEQGAIREQLQVHIQTIGILVSEKSELQTALSYTQQAARHKTAGEAEDLSSRLQASKQRVSELERTLSTVSTQQKQFEKHNKELEKERDSLRLEVFRVCCMNMESRQQSSELSEQLKLRVNENNGLKQEVDELRKRLEMADVMLQQFSSQSGPPSEGQQVQLLLEEKHQLEAHAAQLMESVAQLQVERDQYSGQIQEEGRLWKDKTEQLLSQERDSTAAQIQDLQEKITELENAAVLMSKEQEPQAVSQASGPSESELALQETISSLQQERDALSLQYQAQVRDNEQLSRLVQEQEVRLEELERHAERAAEEAQDRLQILEDVQSDKATISRALAQNRDLKNQLAELQNGFVNCSLCAPNPTLRSSSHQLQEKCGELASVQEHRDQLIIVWLTLNFYKEYLFGFETLVFVTLQIFFMHQELVTLQRERKNVVCVCVCVCVCVGEYIALYQNQRAIMKQRHFEKEQYINILAKDKEEMKAKLAELQDLVMRLVGERNEWYSRYTSAVSNPGLLSSGGEHLHPADGHTDAVLDLSTAVEASTAPQSGTDPQTQSQSPERPGSAPLRPTEDGTARQIMQLLQEIQNPQARPAPFLGENPCIPFFYRPDEHDEVKILVV